MAATNRGARIIEAPKAKTPSPRKWIAVYAAKAPIMYMEPCARFGIRSTPRMRVRPDDTMNRIVVRLNPTSSWDSVPEEKRDVGGNIAGGGQLSSPRLPDLLAGGQGVLSGD